MKTCDLERFELSYWVAKAENYTIKDSAHDEGCHTVYDSNGCRVGDLPKANDYKGTVFGLYDPVTKWELAGPIIEREKITFWHYSERGIGPWHAQVSLQAEHLKDLGIEEECRTVPGPTPLVAAMRAYIQSKYGNEVET